MDSTTERLFADNHDLIIVEAARRFGLDGNCVKRLGSFESAVYEVTDGTVPYILKATDDVHRRPDEIRAELDWVNYLADNEVPVCGAIASRGGELVEEIILPGNGNRTVSLILYEKADGQRLTSETCTDELIRKWGECLGRMHALTRKFQPKDGRHRHHWHEDADLVPSPGLVEKEPVALEHIQTLMQRLRSLPAEPDSYGLVHLDLHHGNFLVSDGNLMVFDTDDCQYDWFASDLCIPLYYFHHDPKLGGKSTEFARRFWGNFLDGYHRHYRLEKEWLERIPDFLKLRELLLFMVIIAEDLAESDPWCRRFMQTHRPQIESGAPVIDLDFTAM